MNTTNKKVLSVYVCLAALVPSVFHLWVRDVKGQTTAPSSRSAPATQKALSPTTRTLDAASQAAMDKAFYEALYLFMCGEIDKTYDMLDKAIETKTPTENWYLYLPLYKRCFQVVAGIPPDNPHLNRRATAYVKMLKENKDPKATHLVKLAVILSMDPDRVALAAQLKAISREHPRSAWAQWAKWRLLEQEARRVMRQSGKAFPGGIGNVALAREIAVKLESHPQMQNLKRGIMRKWMIQELVDAWARCIVDARRCFKGVKKIRSAVGAAEWGADNPAFEVQMRGLLPETMVMDWRLLSVIDGSYFHPKITRQEVVWTFFENLRKAKVPLPEMIPQDKDVFMDKTKEFLSRLRDYKPRDLVPSGPDSC